MRRPKLSTDKKVQRLEEEEVKCGHDVTPLYPFLQKINSHLQMYIILNIVFVKKYFFVIPPSVFFIIHHYFIQ